MKSLRYIRNMFAALLIVSVLVISGCKDKPSKPADGNTASGKPLTRRQLDEITKLPDANEIAATVNGKDIKEGQINEIMAPDINRIAGSQDFAAVSPETLNAFNEYKKQEREKLLKQLIVENLMEEKVKDANIVVTTTEAEEILKKQLSEQDVNMVDFNTIIAERKMTYNDVIEQVKKEQTYIRYVEAQIEGKVNVTEADAKKIYDENQKAFDAPEQVRASHILVTSEAYEPNDVKQKAKEKIADILKKVKEGADFAELAKINPDSTAPRGGDLGFFGKGEMVPPFEKVAFELPVGQISDIVETDYGYHIIKVTEHKQAGIIPFDEIKKNLIENLTNRKKAELENKFIESLIKAATIKFPAGKEIKFEFSEP